MCIVHGAHDEEGTNVHLISRGGPRYRKAAHPPKRDARKVPRRHHPYCAEGNCRCDAHAVYRAPHTSRRMPQRRVCIEDAHGAEERRGREERVVVVPEVYHVDGSVAWDDEEAPGTLCNVLAHGTAL